MKQVLWLTAAAYTAADMFYTVYRTLKYRSEGKNYWTVDAAITAMESIVLTALLIGR